MKVLHTADWHLGKRLGPYSRLDEQREFLDELEKICTDQEINMVLLTGDVFDVPNPPSEAVELLYRSLKSIAMDGNRPVVVIAGNHDSAERIDAPDPLARESGIFFYGSPLVNPPHTKLPSGLEVHHPEAGFARFRHPDWDQEVAIILAPFANEARLKLSLSAGVEHPDEPADDPLRESPEDPAPKPSGNDAPEANLPSKTNPAQKPQETQEPQKPPNLQELLARRWHTLAERYFSEDVREMRLFAGHFFFASPHDAQAGVSDQLRVEEGDGERSVLHPGGIELISTRAIPQVDYAAFGHLHRPQQLKGEQRFPACYAGSPLAYSLSEADQEKRVVIIESGDLGLVQHWPVGLHSGRWVLRHRAPSAREALDWLAENSEAFVELEVETRDFLSGAIYQELKQAHPRLLGILPVLRSGEGDSEANRQEQEDAASELLQLGVEQMFIRYFQEQEGVPPGEDILSMFRQIASLQEPDSQ